MGADVLGMLGFWFINFTIINRVLEGSFISVTSEMTVVNNMTIVRLMNLMGFIPVPILNLDFLTAGVPRLMKFDYSFFGGYGGFIQYSLYAISFAMAFILFITIIGGLISSFLNRVR